METALKELKLDAQSAKASQAALVKKDDEIRALRAAVQEAVSGHKQYRQLQEAEIGRLESLVHVYRGQVGRLCGFIKTRHGAILDQKQPSL